MLKITEIFKSIQGETTYAGMRSVFVRFCGCNLRCSYCDTKYAYFQGKEMTVDEVFDNVVKLNCSLVTITGGEPLLQDEVYPLVDRLLYENCRVLVETNGSLRLDRLPKNAIKIVDFKCPDSGMCDRMDWSNIRDLQEHDEAKFVISSRKDYDWAKEVIRKYGLCEKVMVLMSIAWEKFGIEEIAEWILADDLSVRLQPQIHKFIWGENGDRPHFCVDHCEERDCSPVIAGSEIPRLSLRGKKSRSNLQLETDSEISEQDPQSRDRLGTRAVVLLSGGIDSSTTLAIVKESGFELYALTFDYGQRNNIELESARKVAGTIGVKEHKIFNLNLGGVARSALTGDSEIPKGRKIDREVPVTYVPARNTIFLSIALAWAEVLGAQDIFIGANALDYSGYPDCRPEYIEAFQKLAKVAIASGGVKIHAPLIDMTKVEIIQKGASLGVDYSNTWSCYDPEAEQKACGECDSCRIRRRGFEKAGMTDPMVYGSRARL